MKLWDTTIEQTCPNEKETPKQGSPHSLNDSEDQDEEASDTCAGAVKALLALGAACLLAIVERLINTFMCVRLARPP